MSGALLARKMAGSKKRVDHVAWQIEVATNEEWEEITKLQGLVVVDVYSEWCGPCSAMASHLKEIKLQLGDDLLHCAIAKSDEIDQLSRFRGRSEPTWLFIAGGKPVALILGANAPLIRTTLLEELENEKQVLTGNRQRIIIPWESFDFGDGEKSLDKDSEANLETDKLPEEWTELDALVLQGSFRLTLDHFVESCKDHPLEIAHRSSVQIDQVDSLILWFPSTLEEDKLNEWVEATMGKLILEVELKPEPEPVPENTEQNDEVLEEGEDQSPQTPRGTPEQALPDYLPITFKLITDYAEKEALIQKITAEAAAAAEAKEAEDAHEEEQGEERGEERGEEQGEEQGEKQGEEQENRKEEPQDKPEEQPEGRAEEVKPEEVQEEITEEPERSAETKTTRAKAPTPDPA